MFVQQQNVYIMFKTYFIFRSQVIDRLEAVSKVTGK